MSGKAINITKTSICHACSYPLTIDYGLPHGMACMMALKKFTNDPWVQRAYLPKVDVDWDYIAEEAMKSSRAKNHTKSITLDYVKERLHTDDG